MTGLWVRCSGLRTVCVCAAWMLPRTAAHQYTAILAWTVALTQGQAQADAIVLEVAVVNQQQRGIEQQTKQRQQPAPSSRGG